MRLGLLVGARSEVGRDSVLQNESDAHGFKLLWKHAAAFASQWCREESLGGRFLIQPLGTKAAEGEDLL